MRSHAATQMSTLSVNDQQWAGKKQRAPGQTEDSRTTKSTLMTWPDSCFLMMLGRLIMRHVWVIIIRALILFHRLCLATLCLCLEFQMIYQHVPIFLSFFALFINGNMFVALCLTLENIDSVLDAPD